MSKKKTMENDSQIEEPLETFPEDVVAETETKAIFDEVFIVDGRMAVCDTEEDAFAIYRACFSEDPKEILPAFRKPHPGEKVLHYRGPDRLPYYGRFE